MQLIKKASNGNYSKLLEATIANYHDCVDNLNTVRNIAKASVITQQLSAFYDIYLPPSENKLNEENWILELHAAKPASELRKNPTGFTELQLMAYAIGAIDYMLDEPKHSNRKYSDFYNRLLKLVESGHTSKENGRFLIEMWAAGFTKQQKRFGNQ